MDLINHLKQKYGSDIGQIHNYLEECEKKLERYRDYDAYMEKLRISLKVEEDKLNELSGRLSEIRKRKGKELTSRIKEALIDLNFLDVKFDISFSKMLHIHRMDLTTRSS